MKTVRKVILLLFALVQLCACNKEPLHEPNNNPSKQETQSIQENTQRENNIQREPLPEMYSSGESENNITSQEPLPVVYPNPVAKSLGLSGQDAVLFDAAVNALSRESNGDICIPVVGIYGSYKTQNETVLLCSVQYHYFYGYSGIDRPLDEGSQHKAAKAIIQEAGNGEIICTSFELSPPGGIVDWIDDFCGPLTDLKKHFLEDAPWDIITTMPTANELLSRYIANLDT